MQKFSARLLSILICAASAPVLAAEVDDLLGLDLDQLLDVKVVTATQHLQKSSDTPANVTVISAQQIRDWGIHDIKEALRLVPGVNVYQSYFGYKHVNFRGVQQELYTNKALILINGHPTYDSLFGDARTGYVPIEAVERIEVIRGPASVLYGTNAMAGVVNIITKQNGDNSGGLTARAGSDDYHYIQAGYMGKNFTVAISERDDDGYDYSGTLDETGAPVDMDHFHDLKNVFLDVYGDSWRINFAAFDENQKKLGTIATVYSTGKHDNQAYYFNANKSFQVFGGELNFWLRYDNLDMTFYSDAFPCPPGTGPGPGGCAAAAEPNPFDDPYKHFTEVERTTFEVQYKQQVNEQFDYIVGSSYEKHESDPFIFESLDTGLPSPVSAYPDNSPEYENLALYTQLQYIFNDEWSGVFGLRWEDNDDSGASDLIPRIGLVQRYSEDTTFKYLYGEAFRSAVFFEKYVDSPPALRGNPDLDIEKIQTFEVAMESRINKNNSITLAAYYLEIDDEIKRVNDGSGPIYMNTEGREMYGIELQWVSKLTDTLNLTLNSTLKDGEEKESGKGVYFSNFDLTAILEYNFKPDWRLSLINNYVGENDYLLNDGSMGSVDDYNLTDFHLAHTMDKFEFSAEVKNLFDEDYNLPEPARRNIAEIPGEADRSFYFTVRYDL